MNNDAFISEVLLDMMNIISQDQLNQLKIHLSSRLKGRTIQQECTDLVETNFNETNGYYIDLYRAELYSNKLSMKTIEQYTRAIIKLIEKLNKPFRDISKEDITFYFLYLQKSKNYSDNSLINERRYLRPFFSWCYDNEYIKKNPFDKIKNVTKQPPIKKNVLTDEEIAKLRDCCNRPIEIALLDFLLSTGVRVGELTSIKLSDIDFMNKSVKVFATKTNQERIVYLKADAMKHIVDYRNSLNQSKIKNDYLFLSRTYTKLSSESVEYILHQLEQRAGINKRITVHVFRKTLASNLFRMGSSPATIASILGHKDFSTTSKFYCSIDTDNIKSEFFKYMK